MVANASEKVTAVREEQGVDGLTFETVPAGRAPLYKKYPGQVKAQGAFLELDEAGRVSVDWNGEIGNAVPAAVYHHKVLRFPIPCDLSTLGICQLGEHVRPLLARIHAGHSVDWNGSNMVGRFTDDAAVAIEELEYELANLEPDDFARDEVGDDEDESIEGAEA
ncbi:MAG TPA: hypothetical protein VMX33_15080 [bacterium]|nr:hypothetical protein [bacterium]